MLYSEAKVFSPPFPWRFRSLVNYVNLAFNIVHPVMAIAIVILVYYLVKLSVNTTFCDYKFVDYLLLFSYCS